MDDVIEIMARAIAEKGFGRPWDDFHECSAEDTDQGDLRCYAEAVLPALQAAGFQIVPAEPTEAMLSEGDSQMPQFSYEDRYLTGYDVAKDVYRAMLTASQSE